MFKEKVTQKHIKIYELYLQRIMKENDLYWSRFNIYFGFNSGILVAIGFFFKPYLILEPQRIPNQSLIIISILSMIGLIFSIAWFLANKDGKRWQNVMNNVMENVENSIFNDNYCSLYKKINSTYKSSKWDVVDINLYLGGVFSYIWLFLAVFSITLIFI